MATTLGDILLAYESIVASVAGIENDETHIGFVNPKLVKRGKQVFVFFQTDHEKESGEGGSEREAQIVIGLAVVDDPSTEGDPGVSKTELLRVLDRHAAIQAAIEAARENPAGTPLEGKYRVINEAKPGLQADGYDDPDRAAYIGIAYTHQYHRAVGAV